MKKLFITTAFILLAGVAFGQSLQKGNLVGFHVMTINLDPNVTMNQFMDFYVNKYIPEFEKILPGVKLYIAKSIRGENENNFGLIYIFDSEKNRDKYHNEDGTYNELGNSTAEKLQPITEELNKLGTYSSTYDDWIIQ